MTDKDILLKASSTIRELHSENAQLKGRLEGFTKHAKAELLVEKMVGSGMISSADKVLEKIAELSQTQDLDVVEKAIDMGINKTASNGIFSKLYSPETDEDGTPAGKHELTEMFLDL